MDLQRLAAARPRRLAASARPRRLAACQAASPPPPPRLAASPRLAEVLSAIRGGAFSPGDAGRYTGLVDGISWHDTFMVCADFEAYWQAQLEVEERWRDGVCRHCHGKPAANSRPRSPAIARRTIVG